MTPPPAMMPAAMERPTFNSLLQGLPVLGRAGDGSVRISSLVTDSRRIIPGSLFFALPGLRANGHAFLDDAIARGAAAIISGEPVAGLPAVAAAQVAAMTVPGAGGQRFILSDRDISLMDLADRLRAALPAYAHRLPRFELPDWIVRLAARFHSQLRENISELGNIRRVDGDPGRALIDRPTIPAPEAGLATARSLIAHGLVKP